jgi:hypothetical protein
VPQRLSIRHRHVEPAGNRLVVADALLPPLAGLHHPEVVIRIEDQLLIRQKIEPVDPSHCSTEVADRARDLKDESTLGRDPERVFAQGNRVAALIEHIPQALECGTEPFALSGA